MYVAEHYLGLKVEERDVYFDEVKDFAECGLCGTAAVISPVGKIVNHGEEICFPSGMEQMGPTIAKTSRYTDRYPDGTYRSTGRMAEIHRLILNQIRIFDQILKEGIHFSKCFSSF